MRAASPATSTPSRRRDGNPAVKLTYDDFLLFPGDGKRHELIDGEHYVTPSPNTKHQRVLGTLHGLIWSHLQKNPLGDVFLAPFDVVFSFFDIVEPDLLYLSHERATIALTPDNVKGVPELVVEIASKGTRKRDETIKRRLYERAGVSEYWLVDPVADTIRAYRRDGTRFGGPLELSRRAGDALTGDALTTLLLPGLTLPLARIFRE